MGALSIRNVVKRYGNVTILKSINLEVRDGEFVILVGPSGCGKSTLASTPSPRVRLPSAVA
jgi:ABC-type sugar transport system ATPase subunit